VTDRAVTDRGAPGTPVASARASTGVRSLPGGPDPMAIGVPHDLSLVERYLALRSTRLGERTIVAYRRELTAFAADVGGDTAVLAMTSEVLALWFRARLREPGHPDDYRRWSLRTAHRKRVTLRTFYEWLRRAGLVPKNPVNDLDLPRAERPRPVVVSADAVDRLFAHIEHQIVELIPTAPRRAALYALDAAVLRLMDRLALRVSEASHIRMAAVGAGERPDGGSEVRVLVHKKGNKPREYPLSGVVLTTYLRWLYLRKEVVARPRHEDYLFVHPWTGYRVSRQRAWHRLKRLAREAGLPHAVGKIISPHKLRHSRARRMLDEGWDLAAVQAVLDHANIATTSIYLEDDEQARLRALRAQCD
jgi:integrase/recombinase XerD